MAHHRILSMGLEGMTCASCTGAITRALKATLGVENVNVNLTAESAKVEYDSDATNASALCEIVEDIGFGASILTDELVPELLKEGESEVLIKTIVVVLDEAADIVLDPNTMDALANIDFKSLENLLSTLPGVTTVTCNGRALQDDADKKGWWHDFFGYEEVATKTRGSAPFFHWGAMHTKPVGDKDKEGGGVAMNSYASTPGTVAGAAPKVAKRRRNTNEKNWSSAACGAIGSAGQCMFSYLTGIDSGTTQEGPFCKISVKLDEDKAAGTGARSILIAIRTFLDEQLAPEIAKKSLNSTVVAQGAFLVASRMQAAHQREMTSLRRAVCTALLFTLPLFIVTMTLMSNEPIHWLRMWMMKEADTGLTNGDLYGLLLCTPVQLGSGWRFHKKAISSIKSKEFGMDFLVSTGTFAAYFYSFASIIRGIAREKSLGMEAQYFETAAVLITVILIGKYLELYARGMTASAINTLVNLRARTARLVTTAPGSAAAPSILHVAPSDDTSGTAVNSNMAKAKVLNNSDEVVDVSLLQRGDIIRLVVGESAPADARIIEGHVGADESMLTGESAMVAKRPGGVVFGGTTVVEGSALAMVEAYGDDSVLGKIVGSVQETQSDKPPIQEIADAVAMRFVPGVAIISLISFSTWAIASASGAVPEKWYIENFESPYVFSFLFGLAVWVSACPCAFGLATPTALLVATGVAAKHGVLVRRGAAMQRAAEVNAVAFDKTGTLTLGKMHVTDYFDYDVEGSGDKGDRSRHAEIMTLLYEAERRSSHPLAAAIASYCREQRRSKTDVSGCQLEVVAGQGVRLFESAAEAELYVAAVAAGTVIVKPPLLCVGSPSFLSSQGVDCLAAKETAASLRSGGKVAILVALRGSLCSLLGVSDAIHPEAAAVLACLRREGIACYMVTGDEPATAYAIGAAVGIPRSHILAAAMPSDKEAFIGSLQTPEHGMCAAFVGDGTNDANALARAAVGIALGGGTDIAIDTGDVVLMKNDLSALLIALDVSRICLRRIKMNYFWALIYNIILVPIAAGAFYPSYQFALEPMLAGAAMAASSVSIVISSLMLYLYKVPESYAAAARLVTVEFGRGHEHDPGQPHADSANAEEGVQVFQGTEYYINGRVKDPTNFHLSEDCDCPASSAPVPVDDTLTVWQKLCIVFCSSCGYTAAKSATGIGPAVSEVMEGVAMSKRAVFEASSMNATGSGDFKACGCKRDNCRCGDDCRCGEIRLFKEATGNGSHNHAGHKH